MSKWILPFEDIEQTDVAQAGGKGASLGALAGKGFPVPPGFVVSAEACRSFFRDVDLHQEVAQFSSTHPDTWADRCETVRRKIHCAEMDTALSDAILSAHADLMAGRNLKPCARFEAQPPRKISMMQVLPGNMPLITMSTIRIFFP